MTITVLGVRHHGPGSARAVRAALTELDPDIILIEGPPEADELVRYVAELTPPVAILAHAPDRPGRAAFWPMADFSPEWQALVYATASGRPVRFIDLPAGAQFSRGSGEDQGVSADPLGWLSRAAGHDDPERWWEDVVDHRLGGDPLELFAAIAEAMTELRQVAIADGWADGGRDGLREAAMRRGIRAASRAGHQRIAVVCGAWHVPALMHLPPARADTDLLRGLRWVPVRATWVPWTSGRLTYASGYGAGVAAPGWYAHLWRAPDRITERWVARVAALLRDADLVASPAEGVETIRLAEAVAAVRGRSLPGLTELNDAVLAVLCHGDQVPLGLINSRMVVGDELGEVPDTVPTVPLQADFEAACRRLRFRPAAADRDVELDLRGDTDRNRSRLLHRLRLIGVPWGEPMATSGEGTFKEGWRLRWRPEYIVGLIEKARYGTTVERAATAFAVERAADLAELPQITALVERVVLADLPDALPAVTGSLEQRSARTGDVQHLMQALPALARVLRYGNVRATDTELVRGVVDSLFVRVSAGLAAACMSLDADAAAEMLGALEGADSAVTLVGRADQIGAWRAAQYAVADLTSAPGLLAGRCVRLLLDAGLLPAEQAQGRLARALSVTVGATQSPADTRSLAETVLLANTVAWLEGFLRGSGTLLLRDQPLWDLLDEWLSGLSDTGFETALPLLRRAFSQFTRPERRAMGEKARAAAGPTQRSAGTADADDWDLARARGVLRIVATALGAEFRDE